MFDSKQTEDLLLRLEATENDTERKIIFLDALRRAAEDEGFAPPILVGGGAVELYSMGGYASLDLDLAGDDGVIARFAQRLGMERHEHYPNIFFSRKLRIILDLRGKIEADGAEERKRRLDMGAGRIVVAVSLEDIIVDRLMACKWGKHPPSCLVAELLIRVNPGGVGIPLLRELAGREQVTEELETILNKYPETAEEAKLSASPPRDRGAAP